MDVIMVVESRHEIVGESMLMNCRLNICRH